MRKSSHLLCPSIHIIFFLLSSASLHALFNPCDSKALPDHSSLHSDQLTVLISGFSESRLPLLRSLAASYASSPSVAAVLILWGNTQTPSQTLKEVFRPMTFPFATAPISVLQNPSTSLNDRFLPRATIHTRSVAICDDDIEIGLDSLDFAFKIWRSDPDHLVGFFARSHDLDLSRRSWIYTVHPDRFSIILTKFMILKTEYLYRYSCAPEYHSLRQAVDRLRNCEDILMNFVVAHEAGVGPVLVGAKKVRDWGDARNEGERGEEREVGLSSRVGHRAMRGECIREFHRGLGRMPLRYSYGKVVEEVGEQGLCEKGGKLVFCDAQIEE